MTLIRDLVDPWLVVACECDCGKVAGSILSTRVLDQDAGVEPDDGEVALHGADWRLLLRDAVKQVHDRTGATVSRCCTVVFTGDRDADIAIGNEAYGVLDRAIGEVA